MFQDTRLGNTPRWFLHKPKGWGMRIHESQLECTVFVGRVLSKGTVDEKRLTGTAFVVDKLSLDGSFRHFYLERSERMNGNAENQGFSVILSERS